MHNSLKKLAANSAIYGLASVLNRFASLLLLPFFTEALTTADYGILSLFGLVTAFAVGILNLGTVNSIGLLYFGTDDSLRRSQIIWTAVLILIVNCIVIFSIFQFGSGQINELIFGTVKHEKLMYLALTSLILTVVSDPFLAYLRMNNKAYSYVMINLAGFTAINALSIWLVLIKNLGVAGMLLAQFLGQLLVLFSSLVIVGSRLRFSVDLRLVTPLLTIGFPSVYGSFATLLLMYSDRWFIERFLGLETLGIYSIGFSFGMFVAILVNAFDTAWPPFFASYIEKRAEAKQIFPRVFSLFIFGFGCIVVLIFAFARLVVEVMTASAFHDAWMVVGIVATAQVMYGASSILGTGIYFSKKLIYISIFKWLAALIIITLNILLIPVLGFVGAACSLLAGYLFLCVATHRASNRMLTIDYEWGRVLAFLLAALAAVSVMSTSSYAGDILVSTVINAGVALGFFFIVWKKTMKSAERSYVVGLLSGVGRAK